MNALDACTHVNHVCLVPLEAKSAQDLLELEFHMVVSCHVDPNLGALEAL